jgi:hypothetical protein
VKPAKHGCDWEAGITVIGKWRRSIDVRASMEEKREDGTENVGRHKT